MTRADGAPVRIREMDEGDAEAVAAVRVLGWRVAYDGLMPRAYLAGLSIPEQAAAQRARLRRRPPAVRDLVAERAGTVVGWACVGPAPAATTPPDRNAAPRPEPDTTAHPAPDGPGPEPAPVGELFALYVTPQLIGTGIGHALMTAALKHAREAGFGELRLWVVRGNTRAQRFYTRAGFTPDGTEQTDEVDGVPVPELRYRRTLG
ncbi:MULTISPECIES: GNAT family N-acetyltransferase [Streptomyces]|uniref:GNAT family N-acetyltransferase n=1 Tax=Streptomyces ramulosus TaxID=47762 RepID=A0ABW1FRR5_9ACTN